MVLNKQKQSWLNKKITIVALFLSFLTVMLLYSYRGSHELNKTGVKLEQSSRKSQPPNPIDPIDPDDNENDSIAVYLGDQSRVSFTTVITTLFRFNKSKHSNDKYDKWSNTMLNSIRAPLVAFVDRTWATKFIERCQANNITG